MLNQSNNHKEHFSKAYKFWEGEWNAVWYSKQENEFTITAKTVHKNFSTLDGKLLIETAEGTSEGTNSGIVSGFSMRYFNKKFDGWVMIQNWPSAKGNYFSTLAGNFDGRRVELFTYETRNNARVKVKYTFSDISDNFFRWDRQSSSDEGASWKLTTKVHGDKIRETGEISKNHQLWSNCNGELGEDKDLWFTLNPGHYTGKVKFQQTEEYVKLDIYRMSRGYGYMLHFQYENQKLNPNQELIHVSRGTGRNCWNLTKITNNEQDHSCLVLNPGENTFKNDEIFNKLSHGTDIEFELKIENTGNEFALLKSKNDGILKEYKLQKI